MRRTAIPLGLLLLTLAPVLAATQTAPASPLDDSTWGVKVTPDPAAIKKGEKVFEDVIMFRNGRVTMSVCVKAGFKPSAYTTEKTADGWAFKTEQVNDHHEKAAWSGEIKGDAMKGILTSTKKDGTVLNYTIEGRKASK